MVPCQMDLHIIIMKSARSKVKVDVSHYSLNSPRQNTRGVAGAKAGKAESPLPTVAA